MISILELEKRFAKCIESKQKKDILDSGIELAKALMEAGKYEDAESVYSTLLDQGLENPRTRLLRANLYMEERNFQEALQFLRHAVSLNDPCKINYLKLIKNIYMYTRDVGGILDMYFEIAEFEDLRTLNVDHMIGCAINVNRASEAMDLVSKVAAEQNDPLFEKIALGTLRSKGHKWAEAEVAWKQVLQINPLHEQAVFHHAEALFMQHRFDEAENYVNSVLEADANNLAALKSKAFIYRMLYLRKEAVTVDEQILHLYPYDFEALNNYIKDTLDLDELDKAEKAIEHLKSLAKTPFQILKQHLYYLTESDQHELALEQVEKAIQEYPIHRLQFELKKAVILFDPAFLKSDEGVSRARQYAEEIFLRYPGVIDIAIHMARVLIFCGEDQQALKVIEELPEYLPHHLQVEYLRAWRLSKLGDFEKSKLIWDELSKERDIVPVYSPILDFRALKEDVTIEENDIVVFSVVRDEDYRLQGFLDYYRKLGVQKFVFIDNDSSDSSLDLILSQEDTIVYATTDTYNQSFNGMRWVNKLVKEKTNKSNWCLYVDVDEFLVYPGIEDRPLPVLLSYLEQNGFEAVRGYMLDVFDPNSFEVEIDQANPLEKELYFYNKYYLSGWEFSPFWRVSGGLRSKLYHSLNIILTKTPIIRGGGEIRYLASSHIISPAKIADVTSLFVHFKYSSKFVDRARVEAERKVHYKGARRFKLYWENRDLFCKILDAVESDSDFVKLGDSKQLQDLGLISGGRFLEERN